MPTPQALAAAKAIHRENWSALTYDQMVAQGAAIIDQAFATPNPSLPPLDPTAPRRKMVITIEVAADFEKRLDNQWMVEREIAADRWTWDWADKS